MSRIIVFGDIHGCLDEWQELMTQLAVTSSDQLISVGDMICRGPQSARTLDLALSLPNLRCVVGNHEQRFLNSWKEGRIPNVKNYDLSAVWEMSDRFEEYMKFLSTWPYYVSTPDLLVVHAGLRPGISLKDQTPQDLTEIREVGPDLHPWYNDYHDPKLIIFGHWVRREPLFLEKVIGLDTGCVYGGMLSAYIHPDQRIVSVPARKVYRIRSKPWGEFRKLIF